MTKKTQKVKKAQKTQKTKKALNKTKAIVIAAVAVVVCVAAVLSVILISNSKNSLERLEEKLTKQNNFQMDIVFSGIPLFGSLSLTCETDGNLQHIPETSFFSETYIETVGEKQYSYTKNDFGKWEKSEGAQISFSNLQDEDILAELMDADNYEPVENEKNVYRQKADVTFEYFQDVTITVEKDSCTVKMITLAEGMKLETHVVISKIGEVNVRLPIAG